MIEFPEFKVSMITLAPEIFSGEGFDPTRHSAPFTAISKFAHGELFVTAVPSGNGWFYRIDYPYYSWAETVVRPSVERRDLSGALQMLNQKERNRNGIWQADSRELTSAAKYLDANQKLAASTLKPEEVVEAFTATASRAASS